MTAILYFSILLHCIVLWVLQVMFPSACSFTVCWFPPSFTTCFSLHGHLQVYRILHIFIFIYLRILLRCFFFAAFLYVVILCISEKTKKNTKENSTRTKHKWKTWRVWPRKKKEQRNRILKYMKVYIYIYIYMYIYIYISNNSNYYYYWNFFTKLLTSNNEIYTRRDRSPTT
jgi:hypothetical protein